MAIRFASALAFAAWLAATAALAQPASAPAPRDEQPTPVAPVTVEAAPNPSVIKRQSWSFVQSYVAVPFSGIEQVIRWDEPVCVRVIGLVPDQAAMIKARIEEVAQEVGLRRPSKGPNCAPNVTIWFLERFKPQPYPVEPRYLSVETSDGFSSCFASRIRVCRFRRFSRLLMMADAKALEGRYLGQVADYMAMLTLTQPKSLGGCSGLPSVFDAFAKTPCPGREIPDGFTPADAALLTAFYKADLGTTANLEQGDIADRMADILIKAVKAGPPEPPTADVEGPKPQNLVRIALAGSCPILNDSKAASRAFDAGPEAKAQRTGPSPGTLDFVKDTVALLEGETTAKPKMDSGLAKATDQQLENLYLWVKCRGPLEDIKFLHVSEAGYDDYEVVFANGAIEWEVAPLDAEQAAHQTAMRYFYPQPTTRRFDDWLKAMQRRQPDYDALAPEAAATVRDQAPMLQDRLKGWGALKSIYFLRQGADDSSIYLATFAHGRVVWKIGPLDGQGRLTAVNYARAPG